MLKSEPDISELSAVPDAYVPVITFKFANIEVRPIPRALLHDR